MDKRISLLGEVLIDLISDKKLNFTPSAGGSMFNTASTLAKLKARTSFYSEIGKDFWGDYLLKKMKEVGIDCNFIKISDNFKTPLAFAFTDDNGNALYDFYKSKFDYSVEGNDLYNIGIFHFGSFFSILDENRQTIERIMSESKKQDFLISYDPNYRKNFNSKLNNNLMNNFERSHIIKASFDDIKNIFLINDINEAFSVLKRFKAMLIIITCGEDGAYASLHNRKVIKVDAVKSDIVDTIGAGDSFSAGILYYLYEKGIFNRELLLSLNEDNLYNMVNFATRISSASLKQKGADIPEEALTTIKDESKIF